MGTEKKIVLTALQIRIKKKGKCRPKTFAQALYGDSATKRNVDSYSTNKRRPLAYFSKI